MTKNRCIGCKRDIASGHKNCPFCGASQSFVRYHMKGGVFLLLAMAALVFGGYQYVESFIKQTKANIAKQAQTEKRATKEKIQQLKVMLEKTKQELELANQTLLQIEEQKSTTSSQANQVVSQLKKQLVTAEEVAKKQEGRASWLGRENTRLKAELKTLKDKVSAIGATANSKSPLSNQATQSVELLKDKLQSYEQQKQALLNQIDSKKKQLESNWNKEASTNSLTAEVMAQREQQLKQVVQSEQNQVNLLNRQINAVKKSIQDIELSND